MEPILTLTGTVMPLDRSPVDTDQICPAEFCKRITKSGYEDALFANWRREPGFVLDDPARAGASILVAGPGFGIGSSREHAVWALRDCGLRAVLAPSFGDIFQRNALANGLLAIALPAEAITCLLTAAAADPAFAVTVDVRGKRIDSAVGRWTFDMDERGRYLIMNGLDEIGLTLARSDEIGVYEDGRDRLMPALGSPSAIGGGAA